MKGAPPTPRDTLADPGNIDARDTASNQEAIVVPWHVGEAKLPVHWISPIYNQYTKKTPDAGGGKK